MIIEEEKFIFLMKEAHGVDISIFEISFLRNIIKSRMNDLAIINIADYFLYLGNTPGEDVEIKRYLYNSFSEFFRNTLTFSYIELVILPAMILQKKKDNEKEIRVWSAACASGQEAYSLAIIFDELVKSTQTDVDCHIFATDINPEVLDYARRGVYQEPNLNKVPFKRVNTYFTLQNGKYKVLPRLGNYIDFSLFDLLSDKLNCPPASIYGNFDLIFCTNVLFYYNSAFRQRIIQKVSNCIAPGGYLITGETEREMLNELKYREIFPHSGIFQKR